MFGQERASWRLVPAEHGASGTPMASTAPSGSHNYHDGPPFLRSSCPQQLLLRQALHPTPQRAARLAQREVSVWVDWGGGAVSGSHACVLTVRHGGVELVRAEGFLGRQPLRVCFERGSAAAGAPFLAELRWEGGCRRLHLITPPVGALRLDGLVLPPADCEPFGLRAMHTRQAAAEASAPPLVGCESLARGFGLELELLTEDAGPAPNNTHASKEV